MERRRSMKFLYLLPFIQQFPSNLSIKKSITKESHFLIGQETTEKMRPQKKYFGTQINQNTDL